MNSFCRPLNDSRLVEHFVVNILEIREGRAIDEAIDLIENAEIQYKEMESKSTLLYDNYRNRNYKTDLQRKDLRVQIFEELIKFERPQTDIQIKLGFGGALPKDNKIVLEKQAFLIIGLPASGKSSIANKISDAFGAIILDSDYAKRKFPEYHKPSGASLVHEESDEVVFGAKEYSVSEYCYSIGCNIVIPRIGHIPSKILEYAEKLKKFDYNIHLILVSLDRQKATQRAYFRFLKEKRYVPLSLIFDGYANEPILTYYRIRNNKLFSSYGKLSTDGETSFIEASENNPTLLFNK